jgi:C4-dicarboxylate transporter, DctM subunit
MEILVLFGTAALLIFIGIPISVALAGSAITTILVYHLAPLESVPTLVYSTTSNYTLIAVPLFITAGFVMESSGIGERLIKFASLIVGRLPGGLSYVVIIVAVFFGGMSGSGTADTAALSAILVPSLNEAGYRKEFSAALLAASGSIGILVPPSIAYVLYGSISGASIGELFVAGLVPGALVALGLAVPSYFATRTAPLPGWQRGSPLMLLRGTWNASLGLAAPAIILGGIYSGVFTPTEAAGVAVIYAFVVGLLIYRSMKPRQLPRFFSNAGNVTSMAMLIVIGAMLFAWVGARIGASNEIASAMAKATGNQHLTVLILAAALLVAGMFLDAVSITFVFIPLFLPVLQAQDINLVWFGVVYAIAMAVGQAHPPVGINLYISSSITGARISGAFKAVLPMIGMELLVLILIVFFPSIALWLPNMLH